MAASPTSFTLFLTFAPFSPLPPEGPGRKGWLYNSKLIRPSKLFFSFFNYVHSVLCSAFLYKAMASTCQHAVRPSMIVSSDRARGARLSSNQAMLPKLTFVNLSLLVSVFLVGFKGPLIRCSLQNKELSILQFVWFPDFLYIEPRSPRVNM